MTGVKVRLLHPTVGQKAGDVIEVDKDAAERLVANHLATRVKGAAKSDKD